MWHIVLFTFLYSSKNVTSKTCSKIGIILFNTPLFFSVVYQSLTMLQRKTKLEHNVAVRRRLQTDAPRQLGSGACVPGATPPETRHHAGDCRWSRPPAARSGSPPSFTQGAGTHTELRWDWDLCAVEPQLSFCACIIGLHQYSNSNAAFCTTKNENQLFLTRVTGI